MSNWLIEYLKVILSPKYKNWVSTYLPKPVIFPAFPTWINKILIRLMVQSRSQNIHPFTYIGALKGVVILLMLCSLLLISCFTSLEIAELLQMYVQVHWFLLLTVPINEWAPLMTSTFELLYFATLESPFFRNYFYLFWYLHLGKIVSYLLLFLLACFHLILRIYL